MALPNDSKCAGRSMLPLSSDASISSTQRRSGTRCCFKAAMAQRELNTA